MPPVNTTATASTPRTATTFNQTTSQAKNRLSDASARNNQASGPFYVVPNQPAFADRPPREAELPIPCPVYTGLLGSKDLPDCFKKDSIYDQSSLEKAWSSLENRLRNGVISEDDALQVIKSGILQTDTGKVLTPLFIKAMMRSIKPLAGRKPEQLREFVEIICRLPPERWANSFGENVNFPEHCDGVAKLIQSQLTRSLVVRDQKISAGELLDDNTWEEVRVFTQQTRKYIRSSSGAVLNDVLGQLKDLIHVRPSPQEAQSLIAKFVEAMKELPPNERQRWPESFPATVQKFSERLTAIEIGDTRPEPTNLVRTENSAVTVAYDFEFGIKAKPTAADNVQRSPESPLLVEMGEIEKRSSFYNEVVTTGPSRGNSVAGNIVWVLNTLAALQPDKVVTNLVPSLLTPAPVAPSTKSPEPANVDISPSALKAQVEKLEDLVKEFTFSIKSQAASSTSEMPSEAMFEQLLQSVRNVLDRLEDPLRFPEASADEFIPLVDQQLTAMERGEEYDPLRVPQTYSDTVESRSTPTWRETFAPYVEPVVDQLASVITTLGSSAASAAASGVQLVKSNPLASAITFTATGTTLAALGYVLTQIKELFPEQSAADSTDDASPIIDNGPAPTQEQLDVELEKDDYPPITESPALHQELIEDKIEEILDTPVAKGQPNLLTSILELMYQSTEHDLLADTQLLQNIETLLEQHSTKEPSRTYAELIQEAEAQTHGPQDVAQSASTRVKRDTADAEALPLNGDVEQNDSDMEVTLDQFLATMDELRRPVVEVDDDIDTPVDPELRTAQDVVRLLRSRRSVGWTDASRSHGDSQLATRYALALASVTDADFSRTTVSVPTHSTLGVCWLNYLKALQNPFFMDWAHATGLDLSTVKIHPESNSISGIVNNQAKVRFTLNDSGWAGVAGPIIKAAKVLNQTVDSIPFPSGSRVPIELVAGFYAEQLPASRNEALQRSTELNRNPEFSATLSAEMLKQRSEAAVETQEQHIANLHTNHGLVWALNELVKSKPDNEPVDLSSVVIPAAPNSLFAAKYPVEAKRMVTADRFISAMGWIVPKTVDDVRNLVNVLTTSIPESPKYGNFQGALSYPIPLKPADLDVLVSELSAFLTGDKARDFVECLTTSPPEKGLKLAIESDTGKELGKRLASKLNVISTQTSGAELVLAALLRYLDPAYGQQRNHVAGYDLNQEANWSATPSEVISELEKHLIGTGKVDARAAPALARGLLAGLAPEFLVKKMPDNLVCSSHTWTMLRISVARIERISPGSSSQMTFEQVMEYGATSAITEGEAIAVDSLSVHPLLDWGIVSGVITPNPSGTYTKQQLGIVIEKFNAVRVELARAQEYLTAPVPLRTDIAKAKAARVLGKDFDLEKRCLKNKHTPQSVRTPNYSVLDLFTTGALKPDQWKSLDSRVSMDFIESKIDELGDINTTFESAFNDYFDNLITGSESAFKYMISQLSIEDRANLEYGTQTYYSLRSPLNIKKSDITPDLISNSLGRHGILIRSQYQNNIVYYEVFPSTSEIRRRTDLPAVLTLGPSYKRDIPDQTSPEVYNLIEAGHPMRFDLSAYTNGVAPQKKSSEVIIDLILTPEQIVKSPQADFSSRKPNAFASDSNVKNIASNAVNYHFITGREKLHDLAKGETEPEAEKRRQEQALDFFLSLIPFKTCVDNIKEGKILDAVLDCTLDALGFIIPGAGAAGKIGKIAKTGTSLTSRGLKIGRIVGGNLVSSANPFDGVGDAFGAMSNGVYKLGTKASKAANDGVFQIKELFGLNPVNPASLSKRADIAQGVVDINRVAGQTENVKALFKEGKWYAFDEAANRPYGPPLENFIPDSSIALERTTFSDGSTAFANSPLFNENSHAIQRSLFTDVVVGDKVYRFDPARPTVLEALTSPTYNKELADFEDVCSIGNRAKRSPHPCFSKIIQNRRTRAEKQLQSIEHKRLHPSRAASGGIRKVVHERRVFTIVDNGNTQKLVPSPLTQPLQFRSTTKGSIINDQHFGLPSKQVDAQLESKTRVVRIDGIVHGIEDQRDARGFLVNYDHQNGGMKTYLVVESDAGLFYYCEYDAATVNNFVLKKLDFRFADSLDSGLIKQHGKLKDQYLKAVGQPINNHFVALPPLDSIYMDLVHYKDYTLQKIENLKAKVALLTDEKKREFVLAVWNQGKGRNVEVAVQAIKVEPITKPPSFNLLSAADQNKFYAEAAKSKVDAQFEATGLGSANKVVANDPIDMRRQVLAEPVVIWSYKRIDSPEAADLILRTGAGNCDQVAWTAKKIIDESGGIAEIWQMPGHTFTVVGVPRGTITKTVDFSEPAFENAWVVDPWGGFSCPANLFTIRLDLEMMAWKTEGKMLLAPDSLDPNGPMVWESPTDAEWINDILNAEKTPIS